MENHIIVATADELRAIVREAVREIIEGTDEPPTEQQDVVYGLDGIARLFSCSINTALRYKQTFLAPAVSQRGRKIVTAVGKARQLYDLAYADRQDGER